MASAAAVAVDISKSPLPDHEQNYELGTTGTITSADNGPPFLPSNHAGHDGTDEDDDESDNVRPKAGRKSATSPGMFGGQNDGDNAMANGDGNDGDEGLFGSEDDEDDDMDEEEEEEDMNRSSVQPPEHERVHSWSDKLYSEEFAFQDVDLVRHPVPEPTDGELYLLKIPPFLSIDPQAFQHQTFQPPVTDHHSQAAPSNTFSAYNTAMSTIRWRRSPSNQSQLQSNARVVRWSDGSLTLQFASKPASHYTISGNALAPPQHNPPKPTPVSMGNAKRKAINGGPRPAYNPELDAFTYLAAGHQRAEVLCITNKFTAALKVQSATDASAEALERLQNSLAAAGNAMGDAEGSGISHIKITEDPELAKKKAEIAEKEKIKAQRRREAQEARDRDRQGRVFGRKGTGLGGLTVGGLEDEDELGRGSGRLPGLSGRKNQPKRGRRGEIYSDDEEDYGRRGRTREDEYDQEDDFLAPSDEEEEVEESDDDDDDGIVEQTRPSNRKQEPSAQAVRRTTPGGEQDAEGDLEDDTAAMPRGTAGSPSGNRKRRRVIDDDDEDE